ELTDEVIAAIEPAVGTHPGFEPLVDFGCLTASDDWPNKLNAMMAFANAGLLLFTNEAMARPDWIRKETYILTWRRSLDPSFKVFYTSADEGRSERSLTANGFEPAHLQLIQRLAGRTAADIADEIRGLMPPAPSVEDTPFETLSLFLGERFRLTPAGVEWLRS